jgi:hypothetical protein
MTPDQIRVAPAQELLQRFHGSRYISSIDLSSAFLQVELEPECRKFTAFLFDNQVFQFTRIPYGLRNSLPGYNSLFSNYLLNLLYATRRTTV